MSLVPVKTHLSASQSLYAPYTAGGGGGGGGNIVASTITLEGSAPITATLASAPNDGFEVRNGGGGGNVVVVATIDEANAGQAEFGIRTLSTIGGGSTIPIGRFEMTADGQPTDRAALSYTLDRAGSGNASTIGTVAFLPGTAPNTGVVSISSEDATSLTVGNGNITGPFGPMPLGAQTVSPLQTYTYVPQGGAATSVATIPNLKTNHWYRIEGVLRWQLEPATAAPAASDNMGLSFVGNFNGYINNNTLGCAYISSLQNDIYQNISLLAQANNNNPASLQAFGVGMASYSTSVGVEHPLVITDLGAF